MPRMEAGDAEAVREASDELALLREHGPRPMGRPRHHPVLSARAARRAARQAWCDAAPAGMFVP